MKPRHTATALSLLLLCLAACGKLLESPRETERIFMLRPLAGADMEAVGAQSRLLRLELDVVPGLDTDRLLTLSVDSELNYFSAARWPDHVPELTRSLIGRSLRDHGWVANSAGRGDCTLDLEIERFFALLDAAGKPVSVEFLWLGNYRCSAGQTPLRVSEQAPVTRPDLTGVVSAYQQCFDRAMGSLIRQMSAADKD